MPVFSHPADQYLHYAGTVLDHVTQYRNRPQQVRDRPGLFKKNEPS